MDRKRVVLDYGHGGSKKGAVYGGIEEKLVNLHTGNEIFRELHEQENGTEIQVMLTRDGDYDIPLSTRCGLINAHNSIEPIQVVMSIHYNSFNIESVSGFEVYYLAESENGRAISQDVIDSVHQAGILVRGKGLITTKQLGRDLAIIHKTVPPALLIEVGYLTNAVDRANAVDPRFRFNVAKAVANGIRTYLERE